MSMLAQGIVGGDMPWPLVVVGIFMGFALIMVAGEEPDAVRGRHVSAAGDDVRDIRGRPGSLDHRRHARPQSGFNDAQKARVDNAGVLTASGLIAGEALCGLAIAGIVGTGHSLFHIDFGDAWWTGLVGLALLVAVMIKLPLANAGSPDEPAPPTAIM